MAYEPDPSIDDAPLGSAGGEPDPWRDIPPVAPASEPTPSIDDAPLEAAGSEPARPPRPPLDPTSQLIVGAGAAVAILGLMGGVVGAWYFDWSGLILIAAGIVAAGAGWASATGMWKGSWPIAARDLALAGGTIAGVLGILFVVEIVFDADDLDVYGGIPGAVVTVALGIAGIALYVGATRSWTGGFLAPWRAVLAAGDLPTRLILGGAGLVVLGWLADVIFGFWYLEAGSEVVTYVLIAGLAVRAAADHDQPMRLPFPVGFVALVLTAIAAIIALQHTTRMFERNALAGPTDWIAQLIYVAGVGVALAGSVLAVAPAIRAMTPSPAVPSTGAAASSALPAAPAGAPEPVAPVGAPTAPETASEPSSPAPEPTVTEPTDPSPEA